MKTAKITLKLCRCFRIGFDIHSPKWNGCSIELHFACFTIGFWNRGDSLFEARSYWNG